MMSIFAIRGGMFVLVSIQYAVFIVLVLAETVPDIRGGTKT